MCTYISAVLFLTLHVVYLAYLKEDHNRNKLESFLVFLSSKELVLMDVMQPKWGKLNMCF